VGSHHEKFDGSGYPKGLLSTDIPLNARIFAIVDVFDALTSKRPYKSPFSYEKTMTIMAEGKAKHFDPELLGIFTEIAKELYDTYAGNEEQGMKDTLQQINDIYFHSDFNTLNY
jgi:HD-GYP domain-containing protein (c-di-GMP phosphodiesterase class II)